MFKKPRINPDELAEYSHQILTHFWDLFDLSIMIELRIYYELQAFKKYRGSILKPFGVHPEYPYFHMLVLLVDDFPQKLIWLFLYLCYQYYIFMEFKCNLFRILIESNQLYRNFYHGFDNEVGGFIASKILTRLRYLCCTMKSILLTIMSKIDHKFSSIGKFHYLFYPWKTNIKNLNILLSNQTSVS